MLCHCLKKTYLAVVWKKTRKTSFSKVSLQTCGLKKSRLKSHIWHQNLPTLMDLILASRESLVLAPDKGGTPPALTCSLLRLGTAWWLTSACRSPCIFSVAAFSHRSQRRRNSSEMPENWQSPLLQRKATKSNSTSHHLPFIGQTCPTAS